jgi:hypothetical protein
MNFIINLCGDEKSRSNHKPSNHSIKMLDFIANDHNDLMWHCKYCLLVKCKKDDPNPNGSFCGKLLTRFSYDKFRIAQNIDWSNEKIDIDREINQIWYEYTYYQIWNESYICEGRLYILKK